MNEQGDQWDISSTSTSVDREEQEKPEDEKKSEVKEDDQEGKEVS